ncbi:MAG: hypothetical protein ACPLXB_00625, partial [Minisyncoccia bacterium]
TNFVSLNSFSFQSGQSGYFWLKDYYSNGDWDAITDFLIEKDKVIAIGKKGSPFERKTDTLVNGLAIMVFNFEGEMEKLRIFKPPLLISNKESALFGYRIFKQEDGYLIFAGSSRGASRNPYLIGDNGFNNFYIIKGDPAFEINWIKSYSRSATDLRDIEFFNGFYYVLVFDVTRYKLVCLRI